MNKENIKNILGKIVEPFVIGLLALIFIIPTITVMNLTPITKQLKKLDVLGVSSQDSLVMTLVEGKHDLFSMESLNKSDDSIYSYSTTLSKSGADSYSKPVIQIENKSEIDKEIKVFGQTLSNTRSNIFIKINSNSYKLQDSKGDTFTHDIKIKAGEKITLFLAIENLSGIQFSEIFDMSLSVIDTLSE